MLQVSKLPHRFWQEAVATSCYLQNRSPHKLLGLNTPYTIWFVHKPNLSHLRVFRAIAYSHIPLEQRKKLDPHAKKCIMVGYGESAGVKGYKLFDPNNQKFLFSRSVTFYEEALFPTEQLTEPEQAHQSLAQSRQQQYSFTDYEKQGFLQPEVVETTKWKQRVPTIQPTVKGCIQPVKKNIVPSRVFPKFSCGEHSPTYLPSSSTTVVVFPTNGSSYIENTTVKPMATMESFAERSREEEMRERSREEEMRERSKNISEPAWMSHREEGEEGNSPPKTSAATSSPLLRSRRVPSSYKEALELEQPVGASVAATLNIVKSNHFPLTPSTEPQLLNKLNNNFITNNSEDEVTDVEDYHQGFPIQNPKFRSLRDIMEETEPLEALVADFSPEIDFTNLDTIGANYLSLSVEEEINGPDGDKWKEAMQLEIDALLKNGTWDLVPPPSDRNIITNKWVLTKKFDAHGVLLRLKARLVARGFSQVQGIDFNDTFAPTLKVVPLRLIFAISAGLNLELHHLDIETTFLHGDLDEEIYMEQPPYFIDPKHPYDVCKLKKSLYGLKQSPRMWHLKLHTYLESIGFTRLQAEPNLYIRKEGNVFVILGVYVDDLPIASNSIRAMKKTIAQLKDKFPVKDLGPLEYCLGIKITRNRTEGTLTLSQRKLVEDILEKYDMADCKPIQTPMTVPCKLSSNDSPQTKMEEQLMKTLPYRQILGSIRYLVSCTRPDLSFCAGFLSRFMQNPDNAHWQALKRILRYLQHTKDMVLTYHSFQIPNSSHLHGYLHAPLHGWSDSDWGGILIPLDQHQEWCSCSLKVL